MDCPECRGETSVIDSRPTNQFSKRRRRGCKSCGLRFTTFEIVEGSIGQRMTLEINLAHQSGRLVTSVEPIYYCQCGNEARYVIIGEQTPRLCALCDMRLNDSRGERRVDRRGDAAQVVVPERPGPTPADRVPVLDDASKESQKED